MSVIPESTTNIYRTSNGKKFAAVARIPLGLWDEPIYPETLTLRVRLSSQRSDRLLVSKEYSVGFNSGSVKIVDHDYGNPGPELAATITNNVRRLYVSGIEDNASVNAQVLYCNDPSFVEWLNYSPFDTDLSSGVVYRATHDSSTVLNYPFAYLDGWTASGGSNRMYSMNGMVYIDFNITGGTVKNVVVPFTLPVPAQEGKDFPIVFTDSSGALKIAKMEITGGGSLWMRGVTDNTLVSGSFFYRMLK